MCYKPKSKEKKVRRMPIATVVKLEVLFESRGRNLQPSFLWWSHLWEVKGRRTKQRRRRSLRLTSSGSQGSQMRTFLGLEKTFRRPFLGLHRYNAKAVSGCSLATRLDFMATSEWQQRRCQRGSDPEHHHEHGEHICQNDDGDVFMCTLRTTWCRWTDPTWSISSLKVPNRRRQRLTNLD